MTKLNIKVSRATSRWLKSQPDYIVEYAGEVLTTLVNQWGSCIGIMYPVCLLNLWFATVWTLSGLSLWNSSIRGQTTFVGAMCSSDTSCRAGFEKFLQNFEKGIDFCTNW